MSLFVRLGQGPRCKVYFRISGITEADRATAKEVTDSATRREVNSHKLLALSAG